MKIDKYTRGFTIVELLVVILVIALLATIILLAINPGEYIARGRDAGRKNTIGQISRALEAYYTLQSIYPPIPNFLTTLKTSGDLKQEPHLVNYSLTDPCQFQTHNGYCYNTSPERSKAVVFTRMESSLENKKCTDIGTVAYFLWSSEDLHIGIVCFSPADEETIANAFSGYIFVD